MERQWDTKKRFDPDYRRVAKLVFLGWLSAFTYPAWRRIGADALQAVLDLSSAAFGVVLGLALLATSPISFPLLCLAHRVTLRRKRLAYIRRNRAADRDI